MEIVSRKEALERRLKKYFTGKPCKSGHVCERYTSGGCVTCCRVRKRKTNKQWHETNRERCLETSRRWYEANREQHRQNAARWLVVNRERKRETSNRWAANNQEKGRAHTATYRAAKLQACPSWVDREALSIIYAACPEGWHVDHEVPLQSDVVCGLHIPWNLQYLPAFDNLSKGNKFDPGTYIHTFPESELQSTVLDSLDDCEILPHGAIDALDHQGYSL